MDAFLPTASGTAIPPARVPAVVVIHGGDFVVGDRGSNDGTAATFARSGLAAFSVDYTLATPSQVGFPLQVRQVLAAVAYVRSHAKIYHVDPDHIATFGTSAGATLAVSAAIFAHSIQPASEVQADVGWSGAYDFNAYLEGKAKIDEPGQIGGGLDYLGCSSLSDPSCSGKARNASPALHVPATSPPTLLATSNDFTAGCETVDPAQSSAMYSSLKATGAVVRLLLDHLWDR